MAVSLRSNISSLTAQRRLSQTTSELSTLYERLASGQRINRASDDAAGLAVSSALNADKRVYNVAGRNLNDAISTSAIMSGALDQQGNILGRLAELAEQSANGTLSNSQRSTLQKEFDSLSDEYDRISSTTIFNGINLLQGGAGINIQAGIRGDANSRIGFSSVDSRRMAGNINPNTLNDFNKDGVVDSKDQDLVQDLAGPLSEDELISRFGSSVFFTTANETGTDTSHKVAVIMMAGTDNNITLVTLEDDGSGKYDGGLGAYFAASNPFGGPGDFTVDATSGKLGDGTNIVQVSSNPNGYTLDIDLKGLTFFTNKPTDTIFGARIDTATRARSTLDTVNSRIQALASLRGSIGASESRFQIALNLVGNAAVVRAAAEGRILDADIASDAARLAQTQIKQQAAVSVLAQANQQPALALQLLRG